MMLALAGMVLGAVLGAIRARARGGNGFDVAQYAAVHALILGLAGMFITVWMIRG